MEKRLPEWKNDITNVRIREKMQETMTTAGQLASYLGIVPESVRQWCYGYSQPSIAHLAKIAYFLACSADYLCGVGERKRQIEPETKKERAYKIIGELKKILGGVDWFGEWGEEEEW